MALCIIASEPGLAAFGAAHPGVRVYCAAVDPGLERRRLHRARARRRRRPALRAAGLTAGVRPLIPRSPGLALQPDVLVPELGVGLR